MTQARSRSEPPPQAQQAQQAGKFLVPTCPSCGEELNTISYTAYDGYTFNPDTGRYEVNYGGAETKCLCGNELSGEEAFGEGPANFQAEPWPIFEPNYDADVPKTVRKSDVECWPCKHCDTLGGNHERAPTKRGTKAGRCNPDDLASYRARQKPEV